MTSFYPSSPSLFAHKIGKLKFKILYIRPPTPVGGFPDLREVAWV
jgi:hypothetical protein